MYESHSCDTSLGKHKESLFIFYLMFFKSTNIQLLFHVVLYYLSLHYIPHMFKLLFCHKQKIQLGWSLSVPGAAALLLSGYPCLGSWGWKHCESLQKVPVVFLVLRLCLFQEGAKPSSLWCRVQVPAGTVPALAAGGLELKVRTTPASAGSHCGFSKALQLPLTLWFSLKLCCQFQFS